MQLCQRRISSDRCTLFLRNLPGEALSQAGFIRGAAWKSCSLRSTLSPFTATSLGKHMAVVKAQLPLTFSGLKANTEAAGGIGRKFLSCQSACAAIQRPQPPAHPTLLLSSCLCNSTPMSSPGSAVGHTAGLPVETHGADSYRPLLT